MAKEAIVYRDDITKILWSNISMVEPYPETIVPVREQVNGTAFFPGGSGLYNDIPCFNIPTIFVLGQDFSTEDYYNRILDGGIRDTDCPTWVNLLKLFKQAEIDLCDCFFSNAFIGLRKTTSMTGPFPGYKDVHFVNRNLQYLNFQIQIMKPSLIITLGKHAANMLYRLSQDDLHAWKNYNALRLPDEGYKEKVRIGNVCSSCVALEHPSMRYANLRRRAYKQYTGNDAELAMLGDALSCFAT